MKKQITTTVEGIVIAAAWDENGDISALDIAGNDEKRYHIADDPIGRQLRHYVRKRLVVDGTIEVSFKGITIYVKRFRNVRIPTNG